MRYYLDTNILVFLLTHRVDEMSSEVDSIIGDYTHTFYASSACVAELIHLCQIGKLSSPKGVRLPDVTALLNWFDENGITIVPVNRSHLQRVSELQLYNDHRDPTDRITLVSSGAKMKRYRQNGPDFVYNKR